MTRPWKVTGAWPEHDLALSRTYGDGEAAFDAALVLLKVAPLVKIRNLLTGEIWSWDDAESQTRAS